MINIQKVNDSKIIDNWIKSRYQDKGSTFSATTLLKPIWWLKKMLETPKEKWNDTTSLASVLGTAMHILIEDTPEANVIKEFSTIKPYKIGKNEITIGGSIDELRFNKENGKWRIGDIKTKGDYSYKKFLKGERGNEIGQLSIYRWLLQDMFDIEDTANIYLFNMAHTKKSGTLPFTLVEIPLWSLEYTEEYIRKKLLILYSDKQITCDCEWWLCDYCPFSGVSCNNEIRNKGVKK